MVVNYPSSSSLDNRINKMSKEAFQDVNSYLKLSDYPIPTNQKPLIKDYSRTFRNVKVKIWRTIKMTVFHELLKIKGCRQEKIPFLYMY